MANDCIKNKSLKVLNESKKFKVSKFKISRFSLKTHVFKVPIDKAI